MSADDGRRDANVRTGPVAALSWEEIEALETPPGFIRILCSRCDAPVTSPVPSPTYVRAWIECLDCQRKGPWHHMNDFPDCDGDYLVRTEDKRYTVMTFKDAHWYLNASYAAVEWTDIP